MARVQLAPNIADLEASATLLSAQGTRTQPLCDLLGVCDHEQGFAGTTSGVGSPSGHRSRLSPSQTRSATSPGSTRPSPTAI